MNVKRKRRGFTLIEIIIAFALFGILMLGIYGIVISAMNNNKAGEVKQKAALYGQEVLEEFKSGDITKSESGSIMLSNDIVLSQSVEKSNYEGEGYLDKDKKYYAKIIVKKNTSIMLDKEVTAGEGSSEESSEEKAPKTCDFNIALSGENSPIKVKDDKSKGNLEYDSASDEPIKLIINTKTKENEKVVVIKDENNNKILTTEKEIKKDEDKENQIKLTFNFDQYRVESKLDKNKYKKLEISVYNQDDSPLNIILKKSEKTDVEVKNKLGNVKVYDNRAENNQSSKLGELYDITVKVTQNGNEGTPIFTGHSSQNIDIK
ncbi:type IV pilus modification PilV family protein [Clostridium uliginosum]|uniref:Prepilin-type N-terminal cleavage/methylation domain-containing protein n=1 Tax=Clostridium uliginosum TaxID=119641 RepID=A0A1I1PH51_9CLOT|nr:prepilin-type N-terminal cleavage/methylation domain-containing protein [Clostridium uliginosum]SFD09141.1 prepilin-type N-terminal cleavage/methylation domain-containing protein [Clostridium uliginosum]